MRVIPSVSTHNWVIGGLSCVNADGSAVGAPTPLFHGSYSTQGPLASKGIGAAGAVKLAFSVVLPSSVDFTTVATLSDTAVLVFDTTSP